MAPTSNPNSRAAALSVALEGYREVQKTLDGPWIPKEGIAAYLIEEAKKLDAYIVGETEDGEGDS